MEKKFTWEIICNDAGQWIFKGSDGTQSKEIYESKIEAAVSAAAQDVANDSNFDWSRSATMTISFADNPQGEEL